MKYMILVYGSQQDYDSMAGKPADGAGHRRADDRGPPAAHRPRAPAGEMAGERDAARDGYLAAAALASNLPQQRYLYARAAQLAGDR